MIIFDSLTFFLGSGVLKSTPYTPETDHLAPHLALENFICKGFVEFTSEVSTDFIGIETPSPADCLKLGILCITRSWHLEAKKMFLLHDKLAIASSVFESERVASTLGRIYAATYRADYVHGAYSDLKESSALVRHLMDANIQGTANEHNSAFELLNAAVRISLINRNFSNDWMTRAENAFKLLKNLELDKSEVIAELRIHHCLALILYAKRDVQQGSQLMRKSLEIAENCLSLGHLYRTELLIDAVQLSNASCNFTEAESLCLRALQEEEAGGENSLRLGVCFYNLATVKLGKGERRLALFDLHRALECFDSMPEYHDDLKIKALCGIRDCATRLNLNSQRESADSRIRKIQEQKK